MTVIELFFIFFKLGLFTIGGGLAALPLLQDASEKYGWLTSEQLVDMIAVSESTPGPIGINMSTYVGYTVSGIPGGIIATMGMAAPSLIIIVLIAHYYMKFNQHPLVQAGFYGLRPAVAGLIGAACFRIAEVSLINSDSVYTNMKDIASFVDWRVVVLFVLILFLSNRYKWHPILFIGASAIIGLIFKF